MPITIDVSEEELAQLREFTQQDDEAASLRTVVSEYIRFSQRMKLMQLSGLVNMEDNWRDLEEAELNSNAGTAETGSD